MRNAVCWLVAAFTLASSSAASLSAKLVDNPTGAVAAVQSHFARLASQRQFNGIVLIGRGDQILLNQAYGLADFELGVPLSQSHVFRIGSLAKPVTAAAVLMAVEEGRLSLDTRFCTVLDFCLASWRGVTIEHLLSHSSGITDHFGALKAVPVEETVSELRRAVGNLKPDEPLKSAPGEAYAYSNFNYVLLGAVVEKLTGEPWNKRIRDIAVRTASPSLAYDAVYELVPGRVRGYSRQEDGTIRNIDYDDHAAYAAGGLRSTSADFFRWSRAALNARLFSKALRDRMVTPVAERYGLGWQIRDFFGRKVYNHTGGIDGFATHVAHYPEADLTIVVFSNIEEDPAILFACDAAALMFQENPHQALGTEGIVGLKPSERCGTA